ncbi:MAG: tripartite tricarboxylate transporter TctB family protein [Bacillota bacterium]
MSRRAQENLVAFLFLLFFLVMIYLSFDYTYKARMVPVTIYIISALIMLLQIYFMNFKKDVNLNIDTAELLTGGKSSESDIKVGQAEQVKIQEVKGGSELSAILLIVGYLVATLLIGMLPAMFLFVFGFFIFITKMKWHISLLITIATQASIYILFAYILQIKFYEGWLVKSFLS